MRGRSWRKRARLALAGAALAGVLALTACGGDPGALAARVSALQAAHASTAASVRSTAARAAPSRKPAPGALPDGFVPTKLEPGQQPPQFIVVSFDGVGWHREVAVLVRHHAEGAVSLHRFPVGYLHAQHRHQRSVYQGPGHMGSARRRSAGTHPPTCPIEIADLNQSLAAGNEIGTHFNGHFCSDNPHLCGFDWNTTDWNNELDQFFSSRQATSTANNSLSGLDHIESDRCKTSRVSARPAWKVTLRRFVPGAAQAHNMTYDSSFTRRGVSWPTQSKDNKIWQLGMAEYPIHGTHHYQITMDYNFYYTQRQSQLSTESRQKQSKPLIQLWSTATYQDMYQRHLSPATAHRSSWATISMPGTTTRIPTPSATSSCRPAASRTPTACRSAM